MIFLAPDIHDLPTGGNIYNRRVIAGAQRPVEVVTWPTDAAPSPAVIPRAGDGGAGRAEQPATIVVDSLLMQHGAALRTLRTDNPEARLVLLAHYLHCVDPARIDAEARRAAQAEEALLPLFDGAVTTSRYVRRALTDRGMAGDAVQVVPPGLDDRFRRAPSLQEDGAAGRPVRLLTVANVLPGKGLPGLLRVLDDLQPQTREEGQADGWTWTVVGNESLDPSFAASFRERVAASSVADRVTLAGTVAEDRMPAIYDAHDVCVVPSRFETCSMSTREAMARGLAVVAYAVGGLPENLRTSADADAGRLVAPGDAAAMADALRDVIAAPEQRRRLGRAARARSRTFPSWADTARQFEQAVRAEERLAT